jgi:acetylornithine deacetylase/succinyl-diaminopimelate desuccinylase-like protein
LEIIYCKFSFVHRFEAHGYTVELQTVAPGDGGTQARYNVLAYHHTADRSKLRLLFNTHLDVVPPWFGASLTEETDGTYLRGTLAPPTTTNTFSF